MREEIVEEYVKIYEQPEEGMYRQQRLLPRHLQRKQLQKQKTQAGMTLEKDL